MKVEMKMESSQENNNDFTDFFSQIEDTTEVSVISSGTQGSISNNVTIDLDALLSDLDKAEAEAAAEAAEAEAAAAALEENDGQNSTDEMREGGENPPRKVHWP